MNDNYIKAYMVLRILNLGVALPKAKCRYHHYLKNGLAKTEMRRGEYDTIANNLRERGFIAGRYNRLTAAGVKEMEQMKKNIRAFSRGKEKQQ